MIEILIKEVNYNDELISVLPLGCPDPEGADIPKYRDNSPACLYGLQKCPYLDNVEYSHDAMKRVILCKKVQE